MFIFGLSNPSLPLENALRANKALRVGLKALNSKPHLGSSENQTGVAEEGPMSFALKNWSISKTLYPFPRPVLLCFPLHKA